MRLNIIKYSVIFCLSAAVLLPSAVKLSHIFNHHEHEVCVGDTSLHFHELDIDCEFYKFKLNNTYGENIATFDIFNLELFSSVPNSYKSFLKNKIQLNRFLRGPPNTLSLTS